MTVSNLQSIYWKTFFPIKHWDSILMRLTNPFSRLFRKKIECLIEFISFTDIWVHQIQLLLQDIISQETSILTKSSINLPDIWHKGFYLLGTLHGHSFAPQVRLPCHVATLKLALRFNLNNNQQIQIQSKFT